MLHTGVALAAEQPPITVHKDPSCGCCSGWVRHLQQAGFVTTVVETRDLDAARKRLGVPDDLAGCHTAEVSGYVVEGHVPALALRRFLAERPNHKKEFGRLKGLGEMDWEELKSTTMDPATRTLLQVTVEEAAEADMIMSILMGDDVESRREFITTNARDVRNLDF